MNGINAFMQSFYSWLQFEIESLKSHSIALKKYLTLLVKIGVFTAINLALYESMLLLRGLPQWSFISLFTTALSGVSLSGFVYVGALMAVGFTLGVSARKGVSMFKSFFNSNRLTQKKSGGTRKRRKRNLQKVESSIEHRAVNDRRLVSRAPLSPNQNAAWGLSAF